MTRIVRFIRKTNLEFKVGTALLVLVILFGTLGPLVYRVDPYAMDTAIRLQAPTMAHPFGTDDFGRDLLSRVMYGARSSLLVGSLTTLIVLVVGTVIGLYASMYTWLDHILMRICDAFQAIPCVLLAIALMAALGGSLINCVLALAIVYTPTMARVARSKALIVREMPFIEALQIQGASDTRIIFLHVLPNIISPLLVQATVVFAEAVLAEAALSFLGIGINPPTASWGGILEAGKSVISRAWWMIVFPGAFIVAVVLALMFMGDGLRDSLDPTSEGDLV